MLKRLTYSLSAAVALLCLLTAPSALGANSSHPAKAHATHRADHRHTTHRQARLKRGTVVHYARFGGAPATSTTTLLGETTVESQADLLPAGLAEAFRVQAGASGLAGAAHLYISSANAATTVVVGLYSDAGGRPGLLLSTGSGATSGAGTWTTVSIAPIELSSGRSYWLAILGKGGTLRYRDRRLGSCPSQTSVQTNLGALPSAWRTGKTYSDCPISAYVTAAEPAQPVNPIEPVAPVEPAPPAVPPPVEEVVPTPPEEPVPPPPAVPLNTVLPSIAGSAVEGQELGASSGSWSGSPTSYAYQWQDCNTSGGSCSNVSGATSSSYKLASSDVGHTVRVVVAASNAGGSTSASSLVTATVAAPPPAAPVDTVLPAVSGAAEEGKTLSASAGTWTGSPTSYSYQWEDCNASGRSCSAIGGAKTSTRVLASGDVGHTLRVVVKATNAGGSGEATSAATATVVVDPPPPAAPVNTVLPAVSGTAEEGKTLSASAGTWSGSPTSYAYQWEDCNTSGASCSAIGGATASTKALAASDVGHTLRVVVKASNAGGTGEATSVATATVAAVPPVEEVGKETSPGAPNLSAKECFENPETGTTKIEACGYPGLADTGVEKGVSLTAEKGTVTFKREEYINAKGEKETGAYEDKRLEGEIYVCPNAKNVTIKNDEVTNSGGKEPGGQLIRLESPETIISAGCSDETHAAGPEHVTIAHVRMTGKGPKEPEAAAECLRSWKAVQLHIEYSSTNYCDGMKINGGGRLEHDLCVDNAEFDTNGEQEHYECISDDGTSTSSEPTIFKDDTFFNTHYETAAIFLQGYAGPLGEIREEENFLAGGDYTLYGGNEDHASAGNIIVKDNRFARCLSKTCPDSHGYFAGGGYYGPVYPSDWPGISGLSTTAKTTWENNFWDDNLEIASEWP